MPSAPPALDRSITLLAPADRWEPIWRPLLLVAGLLLSIVVVELQPTEAATILLMMAAAAVVVIEPKIGVWAIPATVPFGSILTAQVGSVPVTATDVLVAALALTCLVRYPRDGSFVLPRNPWVIATLCLILIMALSMTQSISLTLSLKEIVKWLELLVAAVTVPFFLDSRQDVWRLLLVTIWAGVVEALIGIGQFILGAGPSNFQFHGAFLRAYGTFQQPNPMAGYLNLILPIALAAAWFSKSRWLYAATLVIGLGSLVTFSRAGWVAGTLGVLVVLLVCNRKLRPALCFAALAGLGLALLASFSVISTAPFFKVANGFGLTSINFHHYSKSNFSEIERAAHWVAGLRMFYAHPLLGVGIGNYPLAYPAYHVGHFVQPLGHAHNYFINIAAEAGVLGFIAYAVFTLVALWYALTIAFDRSLGATPHIVAVGMAGAWTSLTFHNLFDVLFVHAIPTLLGVLMGTLALATKLTEASRGTTVQSVATPPLVLSPLKPDPLA